MSASSVILFVTTILAVVGFVVWFKWYFQKSPGTVADPYSCDPGALKRPQRVRLLNPGQFDDYTYKIFCDALAAVSIGAGQKARTLLVADIQRPIAFCDWRTHKAPVVTPALLEGGFSQYEIESIVTSLLAKQVLYPKMTITFDYIERIASDLAFNQSLLEEVKGTLGTNKLPPLALLEDTWVVRLTGNPGALKSAIQRSVALLQDKPVTVGQADPMVFVDPPHQFEYAKIDLPPDNIRYVGKYAYYCMVEDMGMLRDVLLSFRLRNLDMITQGSRQPYQHVDQGTAVTGPEGWK